MFVELIKTGLHNYETFDKPVKITEEFLQKIASTIGATDLTREHSDEKIGVMSNFIFEGNALKCEQPNVDYEGWGFSPVFDGDYKDCGDYYEPTRLVLESIGLVRNPRNNIIYNSKGDGNMDKEFRELIDRKDERITEQQEEIALLKKQVKDLQDSVTKTKNLDKDYKELSKKYEELVATSEQYKADSDKLQEQEKAKKQELIDKISGEQPVEYLNKLSIEDLEDMATRQVVTEPRNHVGSGSVDDDEDGTVDDDNNGVDLYSEETFDAWDKANDRYA